MSLIVATIVSLIGVLLSLDHRVWACWWSWMRLPGRSILVGGVMLASLAAGLIGWGAGQYVKSPSPNAAVSGLLFGLVGAAVVRISPGKAVAQTTTHGKQIVGSGGTLLRLALGWLWAALDDKLIQNSVSFFMGLEADELLSAATWMRAEIQTSLTPPANRDFTKLLGEAIKGLRAAPHEVETKQLLAAFCAKHVLATSRSKGLIVDVSLTDSPKSPNR